LPVFVPFVLSQAQTFLSASTFLLSTLKHKLLHFSSFAPVEEKEAAIIEMTVEGKRIIGLLSVCQGKI
jgi:hypothetical protein